MIKTFADESCLNVTRVLTYSEQQERERGERDGADGMPYNPCTHWDCTVHGDIKKGVRVYQEGYQSGRLKWYLMFGRFPKNGYNGFDSEIEQRIRSYP